jgi:hypothetical protein
MHVPKRSIKLDLSAVGGRYLWLRAMPSSTEACGSMVSTNARYMLFIGDQVEEQRVPSNSFQVVTPGIQAIGPRSNRMAYFRKLRQ